MKLAKVYINASIFIFFTILTIKVADLGIGLFDKNKIEEDKNKKASITRSITLREYSPNTDTYAQPTKEQMLISESLEQKNYRLRTDNDGFIIAGKAQSKNKKPDIIFFGGSTTECIYVEEYYRFPYLVSTKLLNKDGSRLNVLNGGLSGNTSVHSLFAFMAKGIPEKPSFVILMNAGNDLSLLSKTLSYWNAPNTRALIKNDVVNARSAWYDFLRIIKNFLLPNIWNKFGGLATSKLASSHDEWIDFRDNHVKYKEVENALNTQFKSSLKSFVKVARAWGIEPILMTEFSRLRKNDLLARRIYNASPNHIRYDDFVDLYSLSNKIIRDVAQEEGILLIDLDKQVPPTKEFIYDAGHLNKNGSKFVATIISTALVEKYPYYFHDASK